MRFLSFVCERSSRLIGSSPEWSLDLPGERSTFAALDRAAGSGTDLPPIAFYALYQFDEGRVSSEAGFSPRRKEVFGAVLLCRLLGL